MRWSKCLMASRLAAALVACGSRPDYELRQNFEYHFYPEEYEEAYSRVEKALVLEDGTEYQVKIQASCESGTLAVSASCAGEEWAYTVSPEEPCAESLSLSAGSAGQADFVITIEPDTRGSVIVELWGR